MNIKLGCTECQETVGGADREINGQGHIETYSNEKQNTFIALKIVSESHQWQFYCELEFDEKYKNKMIRTIMMQKIDLQTHRNHH